MYWQALQTERFYTYIHVYQILKEIEDQVRITLYMKLMIETTFQVSL